MNSTLHLLAIFFESRNSMKMKRTFSCHFDFAFAVKIRLSLLATFFESRNSMKMKSTFNCHFGFTFHKVFLNVSLTNNERSLHFGLLPFKGNCSCNFWEVLHGVGLPLPTLLQYSFYYNFQRVTNPYQK